MNCTKSVFLYVSFTSDKADRISNSTTKSDTKFGADIAFYTPALVRRNLNRTCELPFLFKKAAASGNNTVNLTSEKDEGDRIRRYAELLMPLLIESWMEVRPASLNNVNQLNMTGDDVHISNEAAFTLKATLEIIEKLYELMIYWNEEVSNHDLTDWFRSTYNKEFCTQFIWGFPYLQGDGFKGLIYKIISCEINNNDTGTFSRKQKKVQRPTDGARCS